MLWLYLREVGSKRVRPLHSDPAGGLPQPRRGRQRRVRRRPGSKGAASAERSQGLSSVGAQHAAAPTGTGPGHTGPVCFSYIGAMTPAILLVLLLQAPPASAPRPL